jgi:hypothetical protein
MYRYRVIAKPTLFPSVQPWLLEINSSPALGSTTSVTARLCSNVLDDAIKVETPYRTVRSAISPFLR